MPADVGCQAPGDDKGNGEMDKNEPSHRVFPTALPQVSQREIDEKGKGEKIDLAEYVRIIQNDILSSVDGRIFPAVNPGDP